MIREANLRPPLEKPAWRQVGRGRNDDHALRFKPKAD
jgi:hypothetical protein